MNQDLQLMMTRVARLGEMSEAEARRIVNEVYQDGIVSRGEAEALFRLNDSLADADPMWNSRFGEALNDYLLTREPPQGWVTDDEADWLIAQVDHHGETPSLDEIDLLLAVLRKAEGAPVKLSRYTLDAVSNRIAADGSASAEMTERMRYALYAAGGEQGIWVSQHEATVLFRTNDKIAMAANSPSWNDLFARAIGNHLMARAHPNPQSEADALNREKWLSDTSGGAGSFFSRMVGSIGAGGWFEKVTYDSKKAARARAAMDEAARMQAEKVTEDENAWFLKRLGWDQKISPAERALIEFLKAEAPGFAQGLAIAA
jgi:hypothetical protein